MADVFQEVEESLREERYRKLFRRYGPLGAAMIAAVILGVAGREGWTAWRASVAARSSDAFQAAQADLSAGRLDAAMAEFAALSDTGARGYATLAKMQEAAAAAAAGSNAEAAALYEEAGERARDPILRDMARLKAAYLIADTLDLDSLEARLAPVMERGAPFELAARELYGAAALAAGDYDRAREAYTFLTVALDAPEGMQRRAQEAIAVIETAQAETGAESPAPPAAGDENGEDDGGDDGEGEQEG